MYANNIYQLLDVALGQRDEVIFYGPTFAGGTVIVSSRKHARRVIDRLAPLAREGSIASPRVRFSVIDALRGIGSAW